MKEHDETRGRWTVAVLMAAVATVGLILASLAPRAEAQTAPEVCDDTQSGCSNVGFWQPFKDPTTGKYDLRGSSFRGADAALTFNGTSIKWTTVKSSTSGKTAVYLDGVKVKTFDGYSSTLMLNQVGFSKTGLAAKKHTIELYNVGKNAASGGYRTYVDQFNVGKTAYQQDNYRIAYGAYGEDGSGKYNGTWSGFKAAGAYGGSYRASISTTVPMQFYFPKGPELGIKTLVGPDVGTMYVDVAKYNPTTQSETFLFSTLIRTNAPDFAFETKTISDNLDPNKQYSVSVYSNTGDPVVVDGWTGDLP